MKRHDSCPAGTAEDPQKADGFAAAPKGVSHVPIGDLSICSNARSIRSLVSAHKHHLRYNESEAAFAVLVRVLARTTTNNSAARASEQSVAQYCSVVPAMCQFAAAQERIIAETAMAD